MRSRACLQAVVRGFSATQYKSQEQSRLVADGALSSNGGRPVTENVTCPAEDAGIVRRMRNSGCFSNVCAWTQKWTQIAISRVSPALKSEKQNCRKAYVLRGF